MGDAKRQAILARLRAILDGGVADGLPGISAAITTPAGDDITLVAGFTDIVAKTPMNNRTAFGIGSITKVFVAVVILQLVEEGRLRLDDIAASVLGLQASSCLDGIPQSGAATVRHLLSHTGGIPSWEDDPEWIVHGRGSAVQPDKVWGKTDTLQYIRGRGATDLKVGTYHYANTNYTILGLVIEHITQRRAEQEIRGRILQPLRMEDTYFEGFERPLIDATSHRYHWATDTFQAVAGISPHYSHVSDDLVDVTGTNLSVSWVAGGMISTPSDLLKLAAAMQSNTLLTPASEAVLKNWHEADERMDMGHGIFRLRSAGAPGEWIGHNGGVLGFTGALWWQADGSCAVSVLANVGSSHAGPVPTNAAHIALRTDLLNYAAEL